MDKEVWFAAWCEKSGYLYAKKFDSFNEAELFYAANPIGLSSDKLRECQFRGVYTSEHLSEYVKGIY